MNKKIIVAVMLLVLCVSVFVGCSNNDAADILVNGSFENVNAETSFVSNWKVSEGSTAFTFSNNVPGSDEYREELGKRYLTVDQESTTKAGSYMYQNVKLNKGKTYKLSAEIKVEKVSPSNNIGVRVAFKEDDDFKGINITAMSGWHTYEAYFNCDTSKELTMMITLGDKANGVSGKFHVDNIKLEQVSEVPEGAIVGSVALDKNKNLQTPNSIAFIACLAILSIFISYALYFALRRVNTPKELLVKKADGEEVTGVAKALISPLAMFIYIILGAFVVRFIILLLTYGFNGNVDVLGNIANTVKEKGFLSITTGESAINRPAGVMYIIALLSQIATWLNIEAGSLGYSILLRLPNLLADIVICYMIYSFAQNRLSERHAAVYAATYAFLPLFFVLGGIYASTLPIAIAFMMAAFMAMVGEVGPDGKAHPNYITSGVYYTISLLFSNYMILLLPVIALFQIYALVTEDKKIKLEIALTMVFSLVFFFCMTIAPCYAEIAHGNPLYYFKSMYVFFKTQTLLTVDSFNLYAIFGQGNLKTRSLIFEVFNWLFVFTMIGCIVWAYCNRKLHSNDKNDNSLLVLLASAMVGVYAILGANSVIEILPISIMLLLLYLAIKPEKRLYNVFTGLSVLSFLNIAGILSINGVITDTQIDKVYKFVPSNPFFITFSVFAVLLAFYFLYVAAAMAMNEDDKVELPPLQRKFSAELAYIFSFKWVKPMFSKKQK